MNALHNRKKVRAAGHGERATGRRLIALLLCLCMSLSLLCDVGLVFWAAKAAEATQDVLNRLADPDTTDTYIGKLLSNQWGSRYAGRIWTDKSVFAYGYGDGAGWDGNSLFLNMLTDGYNGQVGFNADFGTVFSALASSQVVNEYPPSPIDLVIVFDMSASMGQDTRFGLDGGLNTYTEHDPTNDSSDNTWPSCGVLMSDRIKNSRIQATLNAINKTIDDLMKQNPQNRVAVCGYGANATVLMPLAHYRRVGGAPYLTVGGMETLYHPGDLVYRKAGDDGAKTDGWYWINNRDTCYTVKVNAEKNEDTSDESLKHLNSWKWDGWTFTVSNNVRSDKVKAFPGVADPTAYGDNSVNEKASQEIHKEMTYTDPDKRSYTYAAKTEKLIDAVKDTHELDADDYVGYFTNTQGGIYLGYKQLADSEVTTYTDKLTSGTTTTVARIPAAIIMSDGGANFALNKMGPTAELWYRRFSVAHNPDDLEDVKKALRDTTQVDSSILEKYWNKKEGGGYGDFNVAQWYIGDDSYITNGTQDDADARQEDNKHRLNDNVGDEWYNVYIPGKDTLGVGWDGLHGLYNTGADIFQDGTLSSAPVWPSAGVFYSSDNDPFGTSATVLQVLLTASYMNAVVKEHYQKKWDSVTENSRIPLSTYTMSVDTPNVPQWGRLRLYPTLDPKEYSLDALNADAWYNDPEHFGQSELGFGMTLTHVFTGLATSWQEWKADSGTTKANAGSDQVKVITDSIAKALSEGDAAEAKWTVGDETITVTDKMVKDNISYNNEFYDVDSAELSGIFDQILELILGTVFVPLSGDNDAGVGDSITYQDPLGEYMELKNQAVNATTHKDESTAGTYDMALLLFGQMHGLVRAGVYDWQWNNEYMIAHPGEGTVGETPFPMGWYKGDDPKTAIKAASTTNDGSGSYPDGYDYKSAEDAWADGWVMRLDFKTMLQFVPINAGVDSNVHPADAPEQIKNTVYTCYRFAGTAAERNELHRNPIYGEGVPKELQEKWDAYNGNYPVGMDDYSKYPGVYRLSDIRVWTEHTGDFIDTDGALTPEDKGGYDDSLYLNIPVAALPTQLAEITLGPDGPISYKTNLGQDHGGDVANEAIPEEAYPYFWQSTPIRLFYAVGLTEDLIVRDADGIQTGVDVSKISGEYIATHSDPETNNIWFISNWYSNTAYSGYTSDEAESYRTRGDAAVSFSPSEENRYYIFQKPLPLFAHAYRVKDAVGNLAPVDAPAGHAWGANKSGNGTTTWENDEIAATWSGGEFLGTYDDEESFKAALAAAKSGGSGFITDAKGYAYPLPDDGQIANSVITFTDDQLNKVESDSTGKYTADSVSFSSDDYFFLCVEYYLPTEGEGKDISGKTVEGTTAARAVTRVIARKGSGFGSGLHSENIGNGDMLCWTDIGGKCTLEIEYNSRTDTGDNTRGRPTFEKLTYDEDDLRTYLQSCGLKDNEYVDVPNADGTTTPKSYLELDVAYWLGVQADPNMKPLIDEIKAKGDTANSHPTFDKMFDWSVAARTGGIRVGDMFQNIQAKGGGGDLDKEGYYSGNLTHTANNYYIPTLSETSTAGDGLVIDNYLGNNGRLEIANSTLIVTKTLELPDGYKQLTDEQKNKYFDYQAYIQGVTGARSAQRLAWNPFSKSWQKRVESLDILTDNSSLLLDTNGNRALFCYADGTPKQVVEVVEEDGTKYYYADENGLATKDVCDEAPDNLYYLYLPSGEEHTYRLFGSTYEDGTTNIDGAGTTAYFPSGMSEDEKPKGDNEKQTLAEATPGRPAGSRDYWTAKAELIPYTEVRDAELPADTILDSEVGLAAESEDLGRWDHEKNHGDSTADHQSLEKFTLVTVIPDTESTESTIYSPFSSRTQYMTTDLYFGYKKDVATLLTDGRTLADLTEDEIRPYKLSESDLYDQTVPNADRPDLFGSLTNDKIAQNTAEFRLKSGEGLMITGLDNRIVYRFTEKISKADMAKGYTLKEISHIQQRGSESIYRPGVQQIPVYTKSGAVYGANYPENIASEQTVNGLTWKDNDGAVESLEPFAHTNAVMWEYYATMAANSAGNHHQRIGEDAVESADVYKGSELLKDLKHNVLDNPSCVTCDEAITDGEGTVTGYLHYMYKDGKPVDYHYNGEASAMLRNMSRYLVSPTVRFGLTTDTAGNQDATVPAKVPDSGYYDYSGVYSAFGNTGYFAEQVHYTNTVSPEMLVLTKQVVDVAGNVIETQPNQEFTFTLTLTPNPDGTLYFWRGQMANLGKSPEENGPPALDRYTEYLNPDAKPRLETLTRNSDGSYTVKLKAGEAVVIYGLIEGTGYTVTESTNDHYPVVNPENRTETGDFYKQSGTIGHNTDKTVSMKPDKTDNRADFYNQMSTGSLTVEKKILDDDADRVTQDFTFTVKLKNPSLDTTKLTVKKCTKEHPDGSEITLEWKSDGEAWTATFTLKHGEKVVIDGIPLDTVYTVTESGRESYNLESVEDKAGNRLTVDNDGVSGTVTADNAEAYLLFNNAKPPHLPFTGGPGVGLFYALGALFLLAGAAIFVCTSRKGRLNAR